jgi:adenylate cyclase
MRRPLAALLLGSAAFAVTALLCATGLTERLELLALDARYASGLGRKPPRSDIVIAWIDQESMDFMDGQGVPFPWLRSVYGQALQYMVDGGAKAVVFDVLFDQPGDAADDREFGKVLAKAHGDALGIKFMSSRAGGRTPAETAAFAQRGLPLPGDTPAELQRGVALPLAEFTAGADWLGFINVRPDADKAFRHYDLLRAFAAAGAPPRGYPSLALAGALAATGRKALQAGDDRRLLLNFRGPEFTFEHVKFVNILVSVNQVEEKKPPLYPAARFKDKIVLVGINAEGYEDIVPVPLSRTFPGVELHATALDNLLSGDALTAPAWDLALAAFAVAAVTTAVFVLPGVTAPLLALLVLLAAAIAATLVAWVQLVALPVAAPALGGVFAAGAAFLWRLVVEGRQKRQVKRAFASYLAPEVMAQVLANPSALALGGQTREVTLLFTDLAGFTGLAEHSSPEELVAFLNDYFTRMCAPLLAEHGVIDKFIGDAIMALFGAPLPMADHAERAVRAALAAASVSEAIADGLRAAGKPTIETRIGIHTGAAVVGNMGSQQRFDYTAIGDTVNLASRLEGANKFFGTRLLCSEVTAAAIGDAVLCREIASVAVKGRAAPIRVFEPLAVGEQVTMAQRQRVQLQAAALQLLRQGDLAAARQAFAAMVTVHPNDALAHVYLEALAEPGWDGVFRLDSK